MRRSIFLSILAAMTALVMVAGTQVVNAAGNRLRATLSGDNEVGSEGDPDGSGTARIRMRPRSKRVCWTLTWQNISQPQAAHIHKGSRTESGDVVVNLFLTPQDGSETSGCERDVPRRLIRRIKNNPRNYYVNIHTSDYPPGAIRGQLRG